MYADDSFFTLSLAGRVGLVVLSAFLALVVVVGFWKITRQFNLFFKLIFSIFFLWLFDWLSPQVYYTYYLFLFDSLEFKNVIKTPPSPVDIASLMSFSDRANLSNHSKGLMGWGMVLIGAVSDYKARRTRGN